MRRHSLFIAIVASLLSFAAVCSAQVRYSVTDLGTLGGTQSIAYDINDHGQVVGFSRNASGQSRAFLFSDGVMRDLGTLGSSLTDASYGINASGEVVGRSSTTQTPSHPFLYSNGAMSGLGMAPNVEGEAFAINDGGQIVGEFSDSAAHAHAFFYNGSSVKDLGTLGGQSSYALDLNATGLVVGWAQIRDPLIGDVDHAFLYNGTAMQDLGTLNGTGRSSANAVNDDGQVVGCSYAMAGKYHAFLYSNGKMRDLGAPYGISSYAEDINSSGQIVGSYGDGGSGAFLYDGQSMKDLSALIDPASGWSLRHAYAINDLGQITGDGINAAGALHAFLLTPIPEPSTIALAGFGFVGLLGYCWRMRKRKV